LPRKIKDLKGERYGKLVVMDFYPDKKASNGASFWRCKCDCGNEKIANSSYLQRGVLNSCGCLAKEAHKTNALKVSQKARENAVSKVIGNKFGRLLVLKEIGYNKGALLLCQCECGNQTKVNINYLRNSEIKSCGCLRVDTGKSNMSGLIDKIKVERTDLAQLTSKPQKNNKSGIRGVYFDKKNQLWIAQMTFKGKKVLNKGFKNKEEAINARKQAEANYHKPLMKKYKK